MGAAALQIVEEESTVLAALNDDQRRAAQATHKPTLVISPAGTGKTSVLAARYLYMLEQGTPTNRLLAITFSRRAAGEMRERIEIGRASCRDRVCKYVSISVVAA